jgi:hypothetical protein
LAGAAAFVVAFALAGTAALTVRFSPAGLAFATALAGAFGFSGAAPAAVEAALLDRLASDGFLLLAMVQFLPLVNVMDSGNYNGRGANLFKTVFFDIAAHAPSGTTHDP